MVLAKASYNNCGIPFRPLLFYFAFLPLMA
jgi:hypothetical protein